MKKLLGIALATVCLAAPAQAQLLDFEGISNGSPVSIGNFYNGGAGTDFGVTFHSRARAVQSQAGNCSGSGPFALQPSGCGAMYFDGSPNSKFLSVAAGFTTGFSLFYSAGLAVDPAFLQVFDDLNGQGNLLGEVELLPTADGAGNPACFGQSNCPWSTAGMTFAGTAMSIRFVGADFDFFFDDINLGVAPAEESTVPEPSALVLMAAGLAGLGFFARRRQHTQA